MSVNFNNNNEIIVYALEKIISYARMNQYIFLAQCVWWLSSIIGSQKALVIHIDILRNSTTDQDEITPRAISTSPRDIQQDSRNNLELNHVHPGRKIQVDSEANASELDQYDGRVRSQVQNHVRQSGQQEKQFDPLQRTRQGKRQGKLPQGKLPQGKLTKWERKWLNQLSQVSPDQVRDILLQ